MPAYCAASTSITSSPAPSVTTTTMASKWKRRTLRDMDGESKRLVNGKRSPPPTFVTLHGSHGKKSDRNPDATGHLERGGRGGHTTALAATSFALPRRAGGAEPRAGHPAGETVQRPGGDGPHRCHGTDPLDNQGPHRPVRRREAGAAELLRCHHQRHRASLSLGGDVAQGVQQTEHPGGFRVWHLRLLHR